MRIGEVGEFDIVNMHEQLRSEFKKINTQQQVFDEFH